MRNYQKLYYQHYYEMLPNGMETKITRRACFVPAEDPTLTKEKPRRNCINFGEIRWLRDLDLNQ